MAKIDQKDNQLESDEYLEEVNLEELTDFFFATEANETGAKSKKVARAMASYFIAKNYLDLIINEEFAKTTDATIFHLDEEIFDSIH
tara:strand:- start:1538 stop:1798 length:261 start_codon:yes stop_codon:yes gene_type:complete